MVEEAADPQRRIALREARRMTAEHVLTAELLAFYSLAAMLPLASRREPRRLQGHRLLL